MKAPCCVALVLTAAIAGAAFPSRSVADETIVFRDTPTEYEWRAAQAYYHDGKPPYMQTLRLDNPLARDDFYELPLGAALDLDGDGVDEFILAVGHPAACDTQGCDVILLEGELHDLRIDKVLHLPLKVFGITAIVFVGDEFRFLKHEWNGLLNSGDVDGEGLWRVLERTYGEIDLERLDPVDMSFASIDLNGDWRNEVFVVTTDSMICGRGGCSTLLTPNPEDISELYPWRWRSIAPFENYWSSHWAFHVTPHMVRGWRVIRLGQGCYVWHGDRYAWFDHATFRLIPVQGCFD